MSRWLATPFATLVLGNSIAFTTLGLNNRKLITGLSVTQLSQNSVQFEMQLDYYPETFSAGAANAIEEALNDAMADENTRFIILKFGYVSNSPYTGGGEQSPTYKGILTYADSNVQDNHITYSIKGYGVDIAINYFVTVDKNMTTTIKKDTTVLNFVKETLLNNGQFSIVGSDKKFNFTLDIQDVPNITFFEFLVLGAINQNNLGGIASMSTAIITGTSNIIANLSEAISDEIWTNAKKILDFDNMFNELTNQQGVSTDKDNTNETLDVNQFGVLNIVAFINKLINIQTVGSKVDMVCVIDPYSESGNDGTIRIYNKNKDKSSKRNFSYGRWDGGVLSSIPKVNSWDCNFNATAVLFRGKDAKSFYSGTLNSDVQQTGTSMGEITYGLVSSQSGEVKTTSDYTPMFQTNQFTKTAAELQNIFDYPYKATITVLGIPDAIKLADDTIQVHVYVNGTEHHTSGTYLIIGCKHSIVNGSNVFNTTYELVKLPKNTNKSTLSDLGISKNSDNTYTYKMNNIKTWS